MVFLAQILVLVAALVGCAAKTGNEKVRAGYHLEIGNGHLKKGNLAGALGELLKAEELDPDNAVIHNQIGLVYFFYQRFDLAEKYFRDALALKTRYTEARNNLGRVLIEKKKYKEAIRELKTASDDLLYGETEKVLANLGMAYFLSQDYQAAEKVLEKSLRLRRKNCPTLAYYGRTLYELSAFDRAAESLDQAIDVCRDTKMEENYYFAGLSYVKTGQREMALARLEEGLNLFPNGQFAAKSRSMVEILK